MHVPVSWLFRVIFLGCILATNAVAVRRIQGEIILRNFFTAFRDDEGATLVEYTLIVALIAAACIIVIRTLGTTLKNELTTVSAAIP
jgi:Flp pilus assembly pilin Flp